MRIEALGDICAAARTGKARFSVSITGNDGRLLARLSAQKLFACSYLACALLFSKPTSHTGMDLKVKSEEPVRGAPSPPVVALP